VGKQIELLQGTLDMLVLKAVSLGPLHGYGILLRIQQISGEQLEIQQGSLYPALYRLEHQGWIASEWGDSDNRRKAKFYKLTAAADASSTRKLRSGTAWRRSSPACCIRLQRKYDPPGATSFLVEMDDATSAPRKGNGNGDALSH